MTYYTHAGFFHCDEITGYVICTLARKTKDLVRLTDFTDLPTDGIVADIGREHDVSKLRFDHHQGFALREDGFPYASAGLLWDEYGREVIELLVGESAHTNSIWKRVDEKLIKGIDAHDSDNAYSLNAYCVAGEVNAYSLSNVVSLYNGKDFNDHKQQRESFFKAANLIKLALESEIKSAKSLIEDAERFEDIAKINGGVAILSEGVSWKEIIDEKYPEVRFVILPSAHPANPFSMIAVPLEPSSRELKLAIERPEWFKGFIHQGKWISASNTQEELERLAEYNLQRHEDEIAEHFSQS
jgi:uncharacterized UPF0160 family protein